MSDSQTQEEGVMKVLWKLSLLAASAGLFAASSATEAKSGPPKPVMKVNAASVMAMSTPRGLRICATGLVPTGGWTKPALDAVHYIVPPADGIYEFNFVATPPIGIVIQSV